MTKHEQKTREMGKNHHISRNFFEEKVGFFIKSYNQVGTPPQDTPPKRWWYCKIPGGVGHPTIPPPHRGKMSSLDLHLSTPDPLKPGLNFTPT